MKSRSDLMSTEYGRIETNDEVVDVLFAVIIGEKTPRGISKRLKSTGSVVRSKLQFLKKSKVVIKDKWDYSPDWTGIYKAMMKALQVVLDGYEKIRKGSTRKIRANVKSYFSEELVRNILTTYSKAYLNGFPKLSMRLILDNFLSQLAQSDEERAKKIDPKLVFVRKELKKLPSAWNV